MKIAWNIGDCVKDACGNIGIVCINWDDGGLSTVDEDTAHPEPRWMPQSQYDIEGKKRR